MTSSQPASVDRQCNTHLYNGVFALRPDEPQFHERFAGNRRYHTLDVNVPAWETSERASERIPDLHIGPRHQPRLPPPRCAAPPVEARARSVSATRSLSVSLRYLVELLLLTSFLLLLLAGRPAARSLRRSARFLRVCPFHCRATATEVLASASSAPKEMSRRV